MQVVIPFTDWYCLFSSDGTCYIKNKNVLNYLAKMSTIFNKKACVHNCYKILTFKYKPIYIELFQTEDKLCGYRL